MTKTIYTDSTTKLFTVKYYVATETGYLEHLQYAVSSMPRLDLSANAMLILGNSYILSTIALLPETITAMYHF